MGENFREVSFDITNIYDLTIEDKYFEHDYCCSFTINLDGFTQNISSTRYFDIIHFAGAVRSHLSNVKNSFISLAFTLSEMHRKGFYVGPFYDFVEKQFGLCRSTCTKLFAVNREFAVGGVIKEKYAGYSYSQLENMVPLSESEREDIKPTMTIAEIKDFKRNNKKLVSVKLADVRAVVLDVCAGCFCEKNIIKDELCQDCLDEIKQSMVVDVRECNALSVDDKPIVVDEKSILILDYKETKVIESLIDKIRVGSAFELTDFQCRDFLFYYLESGSFVQQLNEFYEHQLSEADRQGFFYDNNIKISSEDA